MNIMAEDRYESEHHLTLRGWVDGSTWFFRDLQEEVKKPEDTVETWRREEVQSSMYSKPEVEWELVWENTKYSEAERKEIREKFPYKFN
jgi:hypothetical protein